MQFRFSLVIFGVLAFAACGGGGSGGGGDDDDTVDANNGTPDTPDPPATDGIGTTCTPDQNNPQGSCPAGFVCLAVQGGTNAWCTKTCTMGAGDTCAQGYTGPGKAQCIVQAMPQGGGPTQTLCGVICEDTTQGNQICPAGQCDGTCPGTLMCTSPIKDQNMNTVGNACQ